MRIRLAMPEDSSALLEIYGQYIDTPTTFEYELPEILDFARRIANTLQEYPYLVAEEDGRIVGYAYAHRLRERAAYQWNAELSVYVDTAYVSNGIGKKLYERLIAILRLQGVKMVCGAVTMPNEKSERLHQGLGFTCLGTYHNTGYKNGAWHDVAWFEKAIGEFEGEPDPVRLFPSLDEDELTTFLCED